MRGLGSHWSASLLIPEGDIGKKLIAAVLNQEAAKALLSDDHFSVFIGINLFECEVPHIFGPF